MTWTRGGLIALATVVSLGAAPATPSFHEVEKIISSIQQGWSQIPPEQNPFATSWNGYFDSITTELNHYKTSASPEDRLDALKILSKKANALGFVAWGPAQNLRIALLNWIRPRAALVWAEYRVLEAVTGLPEEQAANREKWDAFIQQGLRPSVFEFESAIGVVQRREARAKVQAAIKALHQGNAATPWSRAVALESTLADLYQLPNLNVAIDSSVLSSTIGRQGIVEPGWIYFREQWSYVTPGPIVGLGFVPTAGGIGLAISQSVSNVTPIQGFQQQVAADDEGKQAAKLYQFDATSRNQAVLTINALFRLSSGLMLAPGYQHNISATISSAPQPDKGLLRAVASLVGLNQRKITDKVYEGAIGKIRSQVVDGASDLAGIKASQKASELNSRIRPFIVDGQTAGVGRIGVGNLAMQSTGDHAYIQGLVYDFNDPSPAGASLPQPGSFGYLNPGVNVSLHLPTALSNLAGVLADSPMAQNVDNLMVVIPPGETGGPPPDVRTEQNVDFSRYLSTVEESTPAGSQAIRVMKPTKEIAAEVDAQGRLVILVPDFTIDLPAPASAAKGGALTGPPAKVYRITTELAEFSVSIGLDLGKGVPRAVGKLEAFDAGPNVRVLAINDDEANAQPLNAFTARIIANTFAAKLAGRPLDFPIPGLESAPVAITDASPLDPSGWMRLTVYPR